MARAQDGAGTGCWSIAGTGWREVVVEIRAGALLYDGERAEHFASLDAGPVVETRGAGDAFNGGLAVALADGKTPREAVRFANAVAALSVTRQGTAPSMPRRGEVDALLGAQPEA